jgi:hypothetical protein
LLAKEEEEDNNAVACDIWDMDIALPRRKALVLGRTR